MEARLLTESDKQSYTDFVIKQGGSFLQSWQWGDLQKQNGFKVLRVAVSNANNIQMTATFLEQAIPHLSGKYLYCAYGPVGSVDALQTLLNFLEQKFKQDYWFVRLEAQQPFNISGKPTLRIQPEQTLITDLTQSEEQLLAAMHNKTRYNIKVAKKHEVQIHALTVLGAEEVKKITTLLSQTSQRHGFHDHSEQYYQNLLSVNSTDNTLRVSTYTATHDQDFLAAAIMIDFAETRTYLFGASSDLKKNLMAPYLVHWQAIQDAKNLGLKCYDWWGLKTATGKQAGFARFKLNFGGKELTYPPAIDIPYHRTWYTIYKVLRRINRIF